MRILGFASFRRYRRYALLKSPRLPEEVVDFEAGDAAVGITIETGEGREGLEVGVTSESLSLSLHEDFLLGGSLEEFL